MTKILYSKVYKFDSIGYNMVKYIIYEDVGIDYRFKDIPNIISIEMISEKNCKIKSMISSFENSTNLKKNNYKRIWY